MTSFGSGRALCSCFLAAALMAMLGCGSNDGLIAISGEVTFEGAPIEKGSISVMPIDGHGSPAGGEIKNGRYTVRTVPGEQTVLIYAQQQVEKQNASAADIDRGLNVYEQQFLPAAYNDQSKLRIKVDDSHRNFNFALNQQADVPVTAAE
ncbi:hypothetical protein [Blastopirellula retiformator]|uniref:Carboxypeptidase regulatory-like domain-containing protein n=1 Tax=Blastopirellula retiformator TaxID=2527970 RepID=A0A5C5V1N4_9BACT|nr:hypothetical protein [Blastopirellula retiformator]TWT31677.1 hypothetical protein Enr8_36010 [Blastopirellula retiformator]